MEQRPRPQVCSIAETAYVEVHVLPGLHTACNTIRAAVVEFNAPPDSIKFRLIPKRRLDALQPEQRVKIYSEYMDTLRTSAIKREDAALKRPHNLFHIKCMAEKYLVDHAKYVEALGCTHPLAKMWVDLCESTHLTEQWRDTIANSNAQMPAILTQSREKASELDTAKDLEAVIDDEFKDDDIKESEGLYDIRRLVKGEKPTVDYASWIPGMMFASELQRAAMQRYLDDAETVHTDVEYHQCVLGLATDMISIQRVTDYMIHCATLTPEQLEDMCASLHRGKDMVVAFVPLIHASKAFLEKHNAEQ